MTHRDRIMLAVAYVLLVLTTAWSAWDTQQTLDRIETQNCIGAELTVLTGVGLLYTFGDQAGVDVAARDDLIETFVEINEELFVACPEIEALLAAAVE